MAQSFNLEVVFELDLIHLRERRNMLIVLVVGNGLTQIITGTGDLFT